MDRKGVVNDVGTMEGTTVWTGQVAVSHKFDPHTGEPLLPMRFSDMQGSAGSQAEYSWKMNGLHLKFSDGRSLVALRFLVPADADVNWDEAVSFDPATIGAKALENHPFDAGKQAASWLEKLPSAQRPSAVACMNITVPIEEELRLSSDDLPLASVLLHCLGMPEAPLLAGALSLRRSRNFWQRNPWLEHPYREYDPTGTYADTESVEKAWAERHDGSPESPSLALIRGLWREAFMALRHTYHSRMPSAETLVDISDSILLDLPDTGRQRKILKNMVIAASSGTDTPVAEMSLREQLRIWGAPKDPRDSMRVIFRGEGNRMTGTTSFGGAGKVFVPTPDMADALVGLLGEEEICAFMDFQGARSIGDNALRALAQLAGEDPRSWVGADPGADWTAPERKRVAAAIQDWWRDNGEAKKAEIRERQDRKNL